MSSSRHLLMAVAAFVVIVLTGGALLVWPNMRETQAINERITELEQKIHDLTGPTKHVERLAEQVGAARRRIDSDFKEIPKSPNMAGMIRQLSLPVDGLGVRDQTFTAGNSTNAVLGDESSSLAMPLSVGMKGSFKAIFTLIQSAESMKRLVRITSVRVSTNREQQQDPDEPVLSATIGLDAIYESPALRESY